jgi:hypothetical protein
LVQVLAQAVHALGPLLDRLVPAEAAHPVSGRWRSAQSTTARLARVGPDQEHPLAEDLAEIAAVELMIIT